MQERSSHRELGIELFHKAWALMEKPDRDPAELLHSAHASAYHWTRAGGTAATRARSEWQARRVLLRSGLATIGH